MNRNIKNKTTDEGLSEPSHKTDVSRRFMVGKFKIVKIKFTFVFRHKWDNPDKMRYNVEFRDYRIGFWFKRSRIVGRKNFSKPKEWGNNLVNDYMIGVDLIICKMWVSFNKGGMYF